MIIDYDPVAPFYDRLAGLVFGRSQIDAQKWLLQFLEPQSRVLIVGGGSGWILDEIAKKYPQGLQIVYVEKSAKMLDLSRQRNCEKNTVEFIQADIESFTSGKPFNAVLTGFLFDNFSQQLADDVFENISAQLIPGALWLYTDFELGQGSNFIHKWMLKAMYLLFGTLCNLKTRELPDMKRLFSAKYRQIASQSFYKRFIHSYAYRKMI